jgi:hypothetical protein
MLWITLLQGGRTRRGRALSPRLSNFVDGYTVGCYSYYRKLVRNIFLKTYLPFGVTSFICIEPLL